MDRETLRCVASFNEQIFAGNEYPFLDYDAKRDYARVIDQRGRWRWYPAAHFNRIPATSPGLSAFTIDDPIQDPVYDCIEVTITLASGQSRWCIFTTAKWLDRALAGESQPKAVGPVIQHTLLDTPLATASGQPFRMIGVPHLIIVSELSNEVIAETLGHLAGQRQLQQCTRLLRRRPRQPQKRDNMLRADADGDNGS